MSCQVGRTPACGPGWSPMLASVLHLVGKLRYGYLPRELSACIMPSSSSATAIAPVGIEIEAYAVLE